MRSEIADPKHELRAGSERRFDSIPELVAQIQADVERVRGLSLPAVER